MTSRRQLFQFFAATIAELALPPSSLASLPALQPQLPVSPSRRTKIDEFRSGMHIRIIGLGGAGCNAVEYMIANGLGDVIDDKFICADTDAQSLRRSRARKTILLGTSGNNTGGNPDTARKAAEDHASEIRDAISGTDMLYGTDMLFITAGMGGGVGTGAAPVVGRIAREMGILTVGMVTLPFEFESDQRKTTAINGLAGMQSHVDTLVVMPDQKLQSGLLDNAGQNSLFAASNNILGTTIGGIANIIQRPCQVGVDFADVRCVMDNQGGIATMGTALASGPDRGRIAATNAIAHSMMHKGIEPSGGNQVLVIISGARGNFGLSESKLAVTTICGHTMPDTHVVYGTAFDDSLGDQIRVTILTGSTLSSKFNSEWKSDSEEFWRQRRDVIPRYRTDSVLSEEFWRQRGDVIPRIQKDSELPAFLRPVRLN